MSLHPLTLRFWHRALALALAVPLLWLAVTGALLGFAGETDRMVTPELLSTPHLPGQERDWSDQLPAELIHSDQWIGFAPAATPFDPSIWQDVAGTLWYVNPESTELRGQRGATAGVQAWLLRLHTGDFLGVQWVYRVIALIASAGLGLLIVTGLLALLRALRQSGRQTPLPLHNLIGGLSAAPLLILLSAVAVLAWGAPRDEMQPRGAAWIVMQKAQPFTAVDLRSWRAFTQSHLPDCRPVWINRPAQAPSGLQVQCADGRAWVSPALNPAIGAWVPISLERRTLDWHTGVFLGQAGRVLWVLAALAVPLLWWSRRRRNVEIK
ncbi:MAG: hypothetical protein B7Y07_00540 [Halothiobacillus sp. 24-54-40]|jgi:hypothetical protein|nr:MAG: hypothetical protein B7Y58_00575 [Halothiobacillus sp. 35-54-62]OYZ88191.1 MAG: hypothetical protein B7Y07_00540 [Halothiobacillus sp. 24-54-40]OZA80697.1 MAG: hypothetical protein B7X64_04900 [Halothiobacillus sp. 39-53-45]HQS01851.1 PepSY-associated TM helix domain-containing protein [Halothiobacillus sp.]HQS28679.1 PepSY-associated TM helix domain-containing protein [Halothiobacillus sp.]